MDENKLPPELSSRLKGFTSYCGIGFEALEGDYCRASCTLEEHHLNPMGIVHGGLTATLMDVCAGTSAIFARQERRMIVTQSAEIHYLRPLTGKKAVAEARAVRSGRRTAVVSVEVRGEDGKLAAMGTYEFVYTDRSFD